MSKYYGYNCPVCQEPIKEPQQTMHTDDGLAHAKCCVPVKRNKKGKITGKGILHRSSYYDSDL